MRHMLVRMPQRPFQALELQCAQLVLTGQLDPFQPPWRCCSDSHCVITWVGLKTITVSLWSQVPVEANSIHSRLAVDAKDFIGNRIDVRDPGPVRKIPPPKGNFIASPRTQPRHAAV